MLRVGGIVLIAPCLENEICTEIRPMEQITAEVWMLDIFRQKTRIHCFLKREGLVPAEYLSNLNTRSDTRARLWRGSRVLDILGPCYSMPISERFLVVLVV